jgi:hypothetical protein
VQADLEESGMHTLTHTVRVRRVYGPHPSIPKGDGGIRGPILTFSFLYAYAYAPGFQSAASSQLPLFSATWNLRVSRRGRNPFLRLWCGTSLHAAFSAAGFFEFDVSI